MSKSVHQLIGENVLDKIDTELCLIEKKFQDEINEKFKAMEKDLQDTEKYINSKYKKMLLQMNIALGLSIFALIVWIVVFIKFI